jgi:Host cell surface-exposed lipoprotein./Protein of unknown function (DUF2510).
MTDSTPAHAPAGWYPAEDGRQRWWNGQEWTDSYQPAPQPRKKRTAPLWAAITAAAVALLVGFGIGSAGRSDSSRIQALEDQVEELRDENDELRQGRETQQDPRETPGAEPSEAAQQSPAAPALTVGQQQAVAKAESYLRFSSFSRTGLIGQLEYEGFSLEESTFAVDFLDIDWNEQAAQKAESYLKFSSFSRAGLIDQLLFEGFTQTEAEFGVAAVGY